MDFPSNQLTLYMLKFERYHLRAYIKGEYTIYLKCCHFHRNSNLLNYLSMPFLSTIVQKGGDCKSKFLPRRFWRLLSKNSRGTNMRFEYKQIIRFLKDGVCVEKFEGQPRGSSYRKTMKNDDPQKCRLRTWVSRRNTQRRESWSWI